MGDGAWCAAGNFILTKMLPFGKNVTFWQKCYILAKMLPFDKNVTFWQKCYLLKDYLLAKMLHFGKKTYVLTKNLNVCNIKLCVGNRVISKFINDVSPLCTFCKIEIETISHLFFIWSRHF